MIKIEGYLTQGKLEAALQEIVGDRAWRGREIVVPGSRRRWDMAYEIKNHTTVIEFDGDEHYRNSLKIKIDGEKDAVAAQLGYVVVRFPYWVQLTTETLQHFFGLSHHIAQDFPHGFITTRVFPASFSELGVERFAKELKALPSATQESVVQSLRDRVKEHGAKFVLPSTLMTLA